MKTQIRSLVAILAGIAVFIAGVLILPGLTQQPAYAQTVQTPTPAASPFSRTISVSGSGSFDAQPDQATIVVGVTTDAKTATDALNQNNQQMQAVIKALSGSNIAPNDIRTQTVQLFPRYTEPTAVPQGANPPVQATETNRVAGYTASNTVQVTVRKLDTLGTVLDQVVAAGGNTIQSVQFSLTDPTKAMDQARQAAMQDAEHRAQQLASLANAKVGQVISISEASQSPIPYQPQAMQLNSSAASAAAVPVSPGSQTVTVNVQVTWELVVSP